MKDIIVIAVVGLWAGLALRKIIKDKREGKSCCGECSKCSQNCKSHKPE